MSSLISMSKNSTFQTKTCLIVFLVLILVCSELILIQQTSTQSQKFFNHSDFSTSVNKSGQDFFKSLNPSIQCPPNLLQRFGRLGEGGKWNCGLTKLGLIRELKVQDNLKNPEDPCIVYSFGVNDDSSWEADVLTNTYCTVYAYDPTVNSIARPLNSSNNRVYFAKLGIGDEDKEDKRTLATLMTMNGHENSLIHILKLDIEGWEYPVLEKILIDFPDELPFAQLLVEFHVWDWSLSVRAQLIVNIFNALEERGMLLFHVDNFGTTEYVRNMCTEYSFVNQKYFKLFGIE